MTQETLHFRGLMGMEEEREWVREEKGRMTLERGFFLFEILKLWVYLIEL